MENEDESIEAIILGIVNQKGGAAKTTTTAALACIYGQNGLKVLTVDTDPQSHLSLQMGVDTLERKDLPGTVSDLYLGQATPQELAVNTQFKGVSIIPASVDLAKVEMSLPGMRGSDLRLSRALESARAYYDLILVDSPPNLGKFAINVLSAADYYLLPVDGPWALRSVDTLLEAAEENAEMYKLHNQLLGIFLTMTQKTRIVKSVREEALERFPGKVFKSEIRHSTLAREAAAVSVPLPIYAADSEITGDYLRLAQEVLDKLGLQIKIKIKVKES